MNEFSLFYSWQTDAPAQCNKKLIGDALNAAVANPAWVTEARRLDSGMDGTAGSPEVATIMFEKIRTSSIFVGDVTLVGRIQTTEDGKPLTKKVPNPNVSVELGYAAATLGWDRVICVMNEAEIFGTRYEQPFDVRNRRFPIDYSITLEEAKNEKTYAKTLKNLTKWITKALVTAEQNEFLKVEAARRQLDIKCLNLLALVGPKFVSFPDPTPANCEKIPELALISADEFNAAVVRLLELGVLFTNFSTNRADYAYHWTYLGEKLLVDMNLRVAKAPTFVSTEPE